MNIDLKRTAFYIHPPNMIFAPSKKICGDNMYNKLLILCKYFYYEK